MKKSKSRMEKEQKREASMSDKELAEHEKTESPEEEKSEDSSMEPEGKHHLVIMIGAAKGLMNKVKRK